jgi:hypothetical protein
LIVSSGGTNFTVNASGTSLGYGSTTFSMNASGLTGTAPITCGKLS